MPYSNAIGATLASLTNIAVYLGNDEHDHHSEYELTPIQVLGAKSVQDFLAFAARAFDTNLKKAGAGRPPKNAASWFVIRTPDGTHLTEDERAAFEEGARDEAGCGSPVVGLMNWHRNKLTGSEDLNLVAAAFTATGQLVRDRTRDPIKSLRQRMDDITKGLNLLRKAKGIQPIQTMQEAQSANRDRADRGTEDITEVLARIPKPPRTAEELKLAVLTVNGEVTRCNDLNDSISILMPPAKRAKRFRISQLLADVAKMISRDDDIHQANDVNPAAADVHDAADIHDANDVRHTVAEHHDNDDIHHRDEAQEPAPPQLRVRRKKPQEPEMLPP